VWIARIAQTAPKDHLSCRGGWVIYRMVYRPLGGYRSSMSMLCLELDPVPDALWLPDCSTCCVYTVKVPPASAAAIKAQAGLAQVNKASRIKIDQFNRTFSLIGQADWHDSRCKAFVILILVSQVPVRYLGQGGYGSCIAKGARPKYLAQPR